MKLINLKLGQLRFLYLGGHSKRLSCNPKTLDISINYRPINMVVKFLKILFVGNIFCDLIDQGGLIILTDFFVILK